MKPARLSLPQHTNEAVGAIVGEMALSRATLEA